MSTPYQRAILQDDPVGYWRLGEPSGTSAVDESGNGHTGTYTNAPTLGAAGVLTSDSDTGVEFDGSADYVSVADDNDLDLVGPLTVEAWIRADQLNHAGGNNSPRILAKSSAYQFIVGSNGALNFSTSGLSVGFTASSAGVIQLGTTYYVVATYDGVRVRLYVNGVQVAQQAVTGSLTVNAAALRIGDFSSPGTSRLWRGLIDEVALYDTALSAEQVLRHYQIGKNTLTIAAPIDDAIGEQVLCDAPTGGDRAEEWDIPDHWLFLDGVRTNGVKLGQLSGQRDIGSRGTLRVTLLKTPDVPLTVPPIGTTVQLAWRDHLQWAGLVENVRSKNVAGTYDTVLEISLDCASWERLAERRLITQSYTDMTTRAIFLDVISTILAAEGITVGVIDTGLTLSFAGPQQEGQYIRCHEFLRDVAEASGGVHEIDPWKRLNFRKQTTNAGAVQLTNLTALQEVESAQERQEYRNVQIIKVRGTDTSSPPTNDPQAETTVTREDDDEIAARQAIEGGSGRYENFEEITHPFSNNVLDCERLGIAAAIVKLNTFGRHQRSVRAQIETPSYRLGEIVTVTFSEHQIAGTWQLAGVRFRSVQDTLRMELDLIQTSILQRAFQGWLKITQAGRAIVQIPGTPIFTNTVTITASGTWVVPDANGDGSDVEVEVASYGAGAGGQANSDNNGSNGIIWDAGAPGGSGGKAVSYRTYAVGTVLTITIGQAGTGGAYVAPLGHQRGTDGEPTTVEVAGAVVAQGEGGSGSGANGGGTGDFPFPGEGADGGAGGAGGVLVGGQNGQDGTAGRVVIAY